jgi:hypothetical protein
MRIQKSIFILDIIFLGGRERCRLLLGNPPDCVTSIGLAPIKKLFPCIKYGVPGPSPHRFFKPLPLPTEVGGGHGLPETAVKD